MKSVILALQMAGEPGRRKLSGVLDYVLEKKCQWNIRFVRHREEVSPDFVRRLSAHPVDGILYSFDNVHAVETELAKIAIPTVVLDLYGSSPIFKRTKNISFVSSDCQATGHAAADFLLDSGVCRSFAFVPDVHHRAWGRLRGHAFIDRIGKHGLRTAVYRRPRGTSYDLAELAGWLGALPKPCGVFVAFDDRALDVLEACRAAGLAVPDEIAVVGVDNDTMFKVTGNLVLSNQKGDGVLDIADGTVSVDECVVFGDREGAGNGTVNIGLGGMLTAKNVYRKKGRVAVLNFNGGTLKAGAEGTLITASDNLAVTVGPLGGTIDNNGKAIGIQEWLAGTGTINLTGSAATAFAAGVEIEGGVSVASGTTLSLIGTAQTTFGSLTLAAGSTLKINSYTPGVTPVAVTTSVILPETGTVNLTLNGGPFPAGVYAIYSKSGVTVADGEKFAPDTSGETVSWSVVGDRLVLTVGTVSGNYWTGFANDGRMSTGANWSSGSAPAAGADIDFSGVGSAVAINADCGLSYGAVTMGAGVITFTNSLTATSFSNTSKVAVDANSSVTIDGDLVFSGPDYEYICYTVATGGVFRVTGDIIASESKTGGYLFICAASSIEGTIAARGLVNNEGGHVNYGMSFVCAKSGVSAKWEIGEHGLSGVSGRWFLVSSASHYAKIKAITDFENSAPIANFHSLELDTGSSTITLGNGGESRGGIMGPGTNIVSGLGKVVANYGIDYQTSNNGNINPTFIVRGAATLALVPGAEISKTGAVTVETGGCLEVARSGAVSLGGDLVLATGATLGFNFTDRKAAPVLSCAKAPTFMDDESTNIIVKVSGDARPSAGVYVLTKCGGFNAEGVSVTLSADAPKWAKSDRLSVNADGNLVIDVKPTGTVLIIR